MRPLLLLAAVLLAPAAAAQADGALFRYATFGPDWTVRLGEPVAVPAARLASGDVTRGDDGAYRLGFYTPFETAVRFVAVTVRTDAEDRVTAIRFDYEPGYDFDASAASYTDSLGPPERIARPDGGEALVWEDDATAFKLVRTMTPEGPRAHSVMSDRDR